MAPIKFEEDIRDKLEKRQLQPSTDAWRSLSDRLDAEPRKRNNKAYWWIGIAASFVGLVMVSSILFLKGSDETNNNPAIVEEETKEMIKENGAVNNIEVAEQTDQETPTVIGIPENEKENLKTQFIPDHETVVEKSDQPQLVKEDLIIIEDEFLEVVKDNTTVSNNLEGVQTVEQQKVDEVVAQIQKLQEEGAGITDAEIDALLGQAQKELASKRIINASTKVVDAELLLMEVETDLDQSFRDRVFEALNSGISKVRTAVADRNN